MPWLKHRSLFLLGPRQTGKSTLLKTRFPRARYVDLLEADTFRELSARPERLRQTLRAEERVVIIDEIQKLPVLLDEVHAMIERDKKLRFVLTGSSAAQTSAWTSQSARGARVVCTPAPIGYARDTRRTFAQAPERWRLPSVFDSPYPRQDLRAYVGTYLREEIQAEALTRSVERFSRFLEIAAPSNGKQVNYTQVGSDCGMPPRTVREHFQILEDTLVGYQLPAYRKTIKRKPVATAKFYFFDVGVANAMLNRGEIAPRSEAFGEALEHLVFCELRAYLDYRRIDIPLTYWRTHSKQEVDFVIGDAIAIEVKGKSAVTERDTKGLRALHEEMPLQRRIVVCMERQPRTDDHGHEIMPASFFLERLWGDAIAPI